MRTGYNPQPGRQPSNAGFKPVIPGITLPAISIQVPSPAQPPKTPLVLPEVKNVRKGASYSKGGSPAPSPKTPEAPVPAQVPHMAVASGTDIPWAWIAGGAAVLGLGVFLLTRKK